MIVPSALHSRDRSNQAGRFGSIAQRQEWHQWLLAGLDRMVAEMRLLILRKRESSIPSVADGTFQ
jgi:hypothetical protein